MGARRDRFGDLPQMQVEAFNVRVGQDEGGAGSALRAGCAEDIGPVITPVTRGARARALFRPDARQCSLLTYPCLVLEPDLDGLCARRFREAVGDRPGEVFLNASWAAVSAFGCSGRADRRT